MELNGFVSWDMLSTYATFVAMVFTFVEFTKGLNPFTELKTKYYSAIVAFILICLVQAHAGTFAYWDIVLYVLSAITISLSANGLSDFQNPVDKTSKE